MANKISLHNDYPVITKSLELYESATKLIPSATQTLAKGPTQYTFGVSPIYLARGKGSHVWDVDGNEFIDYNMGIGPVSLGYCYPAVDEAVRQQLGNGITFSLMHPLEIEVAEILSRLIPNAESVRYSKTGADVTSAAVRLARAFTGKNKVLCCGYHGWHDWYIAVTDRNSGIPAEVKDLSFTFNYNDPETLIESIDKDTACIILEPFVFEEPKNDFLQMIRRICTENNIVLIFDEMWTGFRISTGGAQEFFNIKADLACFSKAIANGMPLSVLTGRKDIMRLLDKEVFFYTTFGGETLSLSAAKAVLNELQVKKVTDYLNLIGKKLKDGINSLLKNLNIDFVTCSGYNCRTIMNFNQKAGNPLELKSLVQQELIRCGVLWSGIHNISFSHTEEDIEFTINAYEYALSFLKKAVSDNNISKYLKGRVVEPVFRKTSNFNLKPKLV